MKRSELVYIKKENLVALFNRIRNLIAGEARGVTRDEKIARVMMQLIFCKIVDESREDDTKLLFYAESSEPGSATRKRLDELIAAAKMEYPYIFTEELDIDDNTLQKVVLEVMCVSLLRASRDALAEAFQVFVGPALRGSQGQFFTPKNVVKLMVKAARPGECTSLIDPACGTAGFIVESMRFMRESYSLADLSKSTIMGIEKDEFLANMAQAYVHLMGNGEVKIYCENSLLPFETWFLAGVVEPNSFDVVLTNPPFGSKIKITDRETLSTYRLARRWKPKKDGTLYPTTITRDTPPQILFIERCLNLLRDGGIMGIVIPESLLGSPSHKYVVQFLLDRTEIICVVSAPEDLFQPSTHTKAAILLARKRSQPSEDYNIFMGIARWCGHDSRGNPIPNDDFPLISDKIDDFIDGKLKSQSSLGFVIKRSAIKDMILVPKYYNPEIVNQLRRLEKDYQLVTIGELVRNGVVTVSTGDEVGKLAYGTGPIPFIRTSDISNWELKCDPKKGLSEEIYLDFKSKQDLREGDILLVKDGTYLIGTSCILTSHDTKIVYQSHLYRLRVIKPKELDPFLLFALLNTPLVKEQIRSKQFTQDIIDTLGNRLFELSLPLPRDTIRKKEIAAEIKRIVRKRTRLREEGVELCRSILPEAMNDDSKRTLGDLYQKF